MDGLEGPELLTSLEEITKKYEKTLEQEEAKKGLKLRVEESSEEEGVSDDLASLDDTERLSSDDVLLSSTLDLDSLDSEMLDEVISLEVDKDDDGASNRIF